MHQVSHIVGERQRDFGNKILTNNFSKKMHQNMKFVG